MFQNLQNVVHLLPKNVSLEELLQSQSKQLQWYNYLLNTVGFDAAAKYVKLLS